MMRFFVSCKRPGSAISMRLVLGAAIAALAVSAGTALGMEVFGLEANPALSAALGAVAAATWAIAIGRRG